LQPAEPATRYFLALARLADDHLEGYRKACASAFERFGGSDDPDAVTRLGYTCIAGPGAIAEPSRLVRLLEEDRFRRAIHLRLLAAALYRAGQPEEALKAFEDSGKTFNPLAWDNFFMAMAHHALGHAAEARRHLDEAVKEVDDRDRSLGQAVWPDWWYWVECHGMRREAEALIGRGR
jgi:tetratricopeptide (TPR) repeat protein